jgi:M6 family metalloprotease-like protein
LQRLASHAAHALLGSCLLLVPAAARAQEPVQWEMSVDPNGEMLDFHPDGAWRVKARAVSRHRASLLRAGDFRSLNAPLALRAATASAAALTGALQVPAIFIRFQDADTGADHPNAEFEARLFGAIPAAGMPFSVRTFYEDISGGLFSVQGQVHAWVTLDQVEEEYTGIAGTCDANPRGTGLCNGRFSTDAQNRLRAGLEEALGKADPTVDFTQFDNDGPDGIPNSGDDDGFVDVVAFYQSEVAGSCIAIPDNNHVWPHRWVLASSFATADVGFGGSPILVRDYMIQSAVGGESGCNEARPLAIGTSSHELGHALGLPDLYDTDGNTEGIGSWGLMGSGNWTTQFSPARMMSWSLNDLGWITLVDADTSGSYELEPVATTRTAYTVMVQGANPNGEYFLLENRQPLRSDSALIRVTCWRSSLNFPDACGGGLAIWHIDDSKVSAGRFFNRVNTGTYHGVALVQADGLNELRTPGGNRGDAGDVWPGFMGATELSSTTSPAAVKNADGTSAGFSLNAISEVTPGGAISFVLFIEGTEFARLDIDPTSHVDTVEAGLTTPLEAHAAVTPVGDNAATTSWTASHNGPSWLTLTTDQGVGTGLLSWSRDPSQLRVGTYVETITVSADNGLTEDVTDSLVVQAPVIDSDSPIAELFGTSRLTESQKRYMDLEGNQDGVYNLGDRCSPVRRSVHEQADS